MLALTGCRPAPSPVAQVPELPPIDEQWGVPPWRKLRLGQPAQGDNHSPDRRIIGWDFCKRREYRTQDHVYGFEVDEAASYRFTLSPQFHGVVEVLAKTRSPNGRTGYYLMGCESAVSGARAVVSVPLLPGLSWVVVDGYEPGEAGAYEILVERDTSATAKLRPEDEEQMLALCGRAPSLTFGERTYGYFKATPGGARASCGVTGSDAVYRLSLSSPKRVRVRAAGQFRPALEIRSGCRAATVTCSPAAEGVHEVDIVQDLDAGEHLVVLGASQIHPLPDHDMKKFEGALVWGAYIIDVEEVPR